VTAGGGEYGKQGTGADTSTAAPAGLSRKIHRSFLDDHAPGQEIGRG
jgi:hypothetical protein